MVAGFITGYLRSNGDYNEALKMGTAAGSATAFYRRCCNWREDYGNYIKHYNEIAYNERKL